MRVAQVRFSVLVAAVFTILSLQCQARGSDLVHRVQASYKKYGQHVSGLKPECYRFEAVEKTQTVIQREIHNKTCGGNSANSLVIARYTVEKGQVLIDDPVSGKPVPFDENFRSDGP